VAADQQLRMSWQELPRTVHHAVGELLQGQIIEATSQASGYSPGSADRVRSESGHRAFVKAVSRKRNAFTYDLHRREIAVLQTLPDSVSAPRLIGTFEDADWVALVLEDVEGSHPGPAPTESDVSAVLSALASLPAIRDAQGTARYPAARAELAPAFEGWTNIRRESQMEALPPWARSHIDELEALAGDGAGVLDGDQLLHMDLRIDNVLIDASGEARIVDWPWASVGAGWFDGLTFLLDARLNGSSVDMDAVLATHSFFADATAHDIDAVLSGMAAYFFDWARRPAPPNMPTLRSFQRVQGEAALDWLSQRLY
jgi:aminoglycoside phosphotransferase (APT) family kinase protein